MLEKLKRRNEIIDLITKLVFVKSKLRKSDLAIVAGSLSVTVPVKSAEVFKKGLVNKIIFTGGYNKKLKNFESEVMKDIAVKNGVSEDAVILEKRSRNTKENAIEALKIVKRLELKNERIILIGLAPHTRRLLMTFSKYFPDSEILVTSPDGIIAKKENWWKNGDGRSLVLGEVAKICLYCVRGDLDFFS